MPADAVKTSSIYFAHRANSSAKAVKGLGTELLAEIRAIRQEIRAENGGGGMCHLVGEYLESKYGWPRPYVALLSDDGRVIAAPHVVNILPDGSLLDSTRDQFGFPDDVAIIQTGSPEMANYRPEFDHDWFPGSPGDKKYDLSGYRPTYLGKPDDELTDLNAADFGRGWWLKDHDLLDAYTVKDAEYRQGSNFRP